MSVRAVAVRNGPWGRFADDHRLIRFKLLLLGIMVLAAMALEVPW